MTKTEITERNMHSLFLVLYLHSLLSQRQVKEGQVIRTWWLCFNIILSYDIMTENGIDMK